LREERDLIAKPEREKQGKVKDLKKNQFLLPVGSRRGLKLVIYAEIQNFKGRRCFRVPSYPEI
jgi:hypothetical protein